jgi:hypothetical protein
MHRAFPQTDGNKSSILGTASLSFIIYNLGRSPQDLLAANDVDAGL